MPINITRQKIEPITNNNKMEIETSLFTETVKLLSTYNHAKCNAEFLWEAKETKVQGSSNKDISKTNVKLKKNLIEKN